MLQRPGFDSRTGQSPCFYFFSLFSFTLQMNVCFECHADENSRTQLALHVID